MMIATVESEQKIDDLLSNKQSSKFIKIGCGLKIFSCYRTMQFVLNKLWV